MRKSSRPPEEKHQKKKSYHTNSSYNQLARRAGLTKVDLNARWEVGHVVENPTESVKGIVGDVVAARASGDAGEPDFEVSWTKVKGSPEEAWVGDECKEDQTGGGIVTALTIV